MASFFVVLWTHICLRLFLRPFLRLFRTHASICGVNCRVSVAISTSRFAFRLSPFSFLGSNSFVNSLLFCHSWGSSSGSGSGSSSRDGGGSSSSCIPSACPGHPNKATCEGDASCTWTGAAPVSTPAGAASAGEGLQDPAVGAGGSNATTDTDAADAADTATAGGAIGGWSYATGER